MGRWAAALHKAYRRGAANPRSAVRDARLRAVKLHLDKPWLALDAEAVRKLPGQLGVFQLADDSGRVLFIGYAGGKSLFGLRSELEKRLGSAPKFRYEVNQQYQTRWRELLMLHQAAAGTLPEFNLREPFPRLGRLG